MKFSKAFSASGFGQSIKEFIRKLENFKKVTKLHAHLYPVYIDPATKRLRKESNGIKPIRLNKRNSEIYNAGMEVTSNNNHLSYEELQDIHNKDNQSDSNQIGLKPSKKTSYEVVTLHVSHFDF